MLRLHTRTITSSSTRESCETSSERFGGDASTHGYVVNAQLRRTVCWASETFEAHRIATLRSEMSSAISPRRRGKGTTISFIAAQTGVSVPTVSKVINGRSDVAPDTRRRVEAAIREAAHGVEADRSGRDGAADHPATRRLSRPLSQSDKAR